MPLKGTGGAADTISSPLCIEVAKIQNGQNCPLPALCAVVGA